LQTTSPLSGSFTVADLRANLAAESGDFPRRDSASHGAKVGSVFALDDKQAKILRH